MDALVRVSEANGQVAARSFTSLGQMVEAFILGHDVAPSSRATYRRSLTSFIRWLESTGRISRMGALVREDILEYKAHLMATKKPQTVTGYLTAVRRLYEWLEAEKLYPNIARGVKGAKKPTGKRKDCLTREQARMALGGIDRSTPEGLRDYALIMLMLFSGIRDIEASRALVGDIGQEQGQAVLWVHGKGRDEKDEFVLLVQDAERAVREWLASRGTQAAEAHIFCSLSDKNRGQALTTRSLSRIIKNRLRAVGIDSERITSHSIRHTAVTLAILGGAPMEQVQAMARHSDPRTTMGYFHNMDRVRMGAEKYITL